MTTTCGVEFENNPSRVIYSGQTLSGTVHLVLSSEKIVRGIYIRVVGQGHTHWTEGMGDDKKSCTGNEDYYNALVYLVGGNNSQLRLSAGSYHYPFQFYLPPQLPTSFEGAHGYIRYKTCVVIDNNNMWRDKEFDIPFTVIKAINLNADPTLRNPVFAEESKKFIPCCFLCCFPSNPLKITARAPVGGYVPGQVINLDFSVNNKSDQNVTEFTVELIKEITYYESLVSRFDKKIETVVIMSGRDGNGCIINDSETFRVNIQVPSIPPSDDVSSKIIKIRYYCRITGEVPGCHINPTLNLPITIGTYPLVDAPLLSAPISQSVLPSAGGIVIQHQPTAQPQPSQIDSTDLPQPSAPPIRFPNDEPPSYEEATQFGNAKQTDFVPKYPMFRRQTSYSNNV